MVPYVTGMASVAMACFVRVRDCVGVRASMKRSQIVIGSLRPAGLPSAASAHRDRGPWQLQYMTAGSVESVLLEASKQGNAAGQVSVSCGAQPPFRLWRGKRLAKHFQCKARIKGQTGASSGPLISQGTPSSPGGADRPTFTILPLV